MCYRATLILALVMLCAPTILLAQEERDADGTRDHPLFSRMTGFSISGSDVKDFDSYQTPYLSGPEGRWEGKFTKIAYQIKAGAKQVSMAQIARNYENAAKKIGGKILFTDARAVGAKIVRGGATTWLEVQAFSDGASYELVIVESKEMEQEVTADAAAMSASIASTGKAAVYGIYFDTGKSIVKPESKPTLDEIVKLLKENPGLKLLVVGHTDNTGELDANVRLSAARAEAVVKSLTGLGVGPARLLPAGVGPYAPAASNRTDEGKAKNRRVELVERN